jgi:S-adenosylmethionine hydrolase
MSAIITLTTDFGHSKYVAAMKGVILGIVPEVNLIDISHEITSQSVLEGAFVMMTTVPFFKNGVHVGVVDPGVGGPRNPIVIECEKGILVGPDNGLLMPSAKRLNMLAVYKITNRELMLESVSHTFHGRDIFAPVAAHLAKGVKPEEVGEVVGQCQLLDVEAYKDGGGMLEGQIVHVDKFGNLISNLPRRALEDRLHEGDEFQILLNGKPYSVRFENTYVEAPGDEPFALFSSSDYLEISIPMGSAAEKLDIRVGDSLEVRL